MANESSFYGDITFYHKGLEDTPENREKFKKNYRRILRSVSWILWQY